MTTGKHEKITIIFNLECKLDIEGLQIGEEMVGRLIPTGGLDSVQALKIIIELMIQKGMRMQFFDGRKSILTSKFLKDAEKQKKWRHKVFADGLSFDFGQLTSLRHSFVLIEQLDSDLSTNWNDWVAPFLKEASFVQAWISDIEYDYWQNAKDPLEYKAVGRNHEHLPKKSNGLPPPLEQLEIDTSNNPGRWSHQIGYVEAIGSVMWLSKLFWERVGTDRLQQLLAADFIKTLDLQNDVVRLVMDDISFSECSSADVQNKLRKTLYG